MPRYRLRYQSTDLEVPQGEFVIGRSSACHLAVDDALVSRRHAVIRVQDDRAEIEDLGSRNGVTLNDERVAGKRPLRHQDRITIGSQQLLFLDAERSQVAPMPEQMDRRMAQTMEFKAPAADDSVEEATRTSAGMLVMLADKAISMGRHEEAERLIGQHLDELLVQASRGTEVEDGRIHSTAKTVLRIADGLGRSKWIDWTLKFYAATDTLMDAETIDRLYDLVRKLHYSDPKLLRSYLDRLHQRPGWSAAERFLVRRLEGLEKVILA